MAAMDAQRGRFRLCPANTGEMTMSLSIQLAELFEVPETRDSKRRLHVGLAATPGEVRALQRLRYQVFVEEMGARLDTDEPGIESDRFDEHCQHLIVRDAGTEQVVGGYRILTDLQAVRTGGFYSQTEFELGRILALPGRIMEVGRTCVHPDYRAGSVIALLWQGLARYMVLNRFDYLMGCASIPLRRGTGEAFALYRELSRYHLAPPEWRVYPRVPLPRMNLAGVTPEPEVPPLIKAYLHMGAKICGDPAWDCHFNVADLFILLRADDVRGRYARHFVNRA
jgi:putative hemolysin